MVMEHWSSSGYSCPLTLQLIGRGAPSEVSALFSYDARDPYAVRIRFGPAHAGGTDAGTWLTGRGGGGPRAASRRARPPRRGWRRPGGANRGEERRPVPPPTRAFRRSADGALAYGARRVRQRHRDVGAVRGRGGGDRPRRVGRPSLRGWRGSLQPLTRR